MDRLGNLDIACKRNNAATRR